MKSNLLKYLKQYLIFYLILTGTSLLSILISEYLSSSVGIAASIIAIILLIIHIILNYKLTIDIKVTKDKILKILLLTIILTTIYFLAKPKVYEPPVDTVESGSYNSVQWLPEAYCHSWCSGIVISNKCFGIKLSCYLFPRILFHMLNETVIPFGIYKILDILGIRIVKTSKEKFKDAFFLILKRFLLFLIPVIILIYFYLDNIN